MALFEICNIFCRQRLAVFQKFCSLRWFWIKHKILLEMIRTLFLETIVHNQQKYAEFSRNKEILLTNLFAYIKCLIVIP